jgi:CRP-like cAMP-binding protein
MAEEEQAARIAREVVLSTFAGEAKGLTWEFRRISAAMQDVYLDEGAVVFAQGASPDYVYFIVDGEVTLSAPGRLAAAFGPKSVVGAIDRFLDRPSTSKAVVTRKAHLLRIRSDDWLDVLEDSFELSRMIVRNMAVGLHQVRLRPPPLGGFEEPPSHPPAAGVPGQLHLVDRILLLRGVPTFAYASIQTLTTLAELATEVQAADSEVLAHKGEPKRQMLVVALGEVTATRDAPVLTGRFGPGALVCGALAVLDLTEYEFRAGGSTRLLAIDRDDYVDLMEEHFGLVLSTARALLHERESVSAADAMGATLIPASSRTP